MLDKLLKANGVDVKIEVADLKQKLADTDYKAIKHSEGLISDEDYAPIKAEREALREQIRALEN